MSPEAVAGVVISFITMENIGIIFQGQIQCILSKPTIPKVRGAPTKVNNPSQLPYGLVTTIQFLLMMTTNGTWW